MKWKDIPNILKYEKKSKLENTFYSTKPLKKIDLSYMCMHMYTETCVYGKMSGEISRLLVMITSGEWDWLGKSGWELSLDTL